MRKLLLILVVFLGCSSNSQNPAGMGITVLVSVVPQKYFVEKIAGNLVDIAVLIPPGASPAAYEISPRDMRIVSEADVWFTIGLQRESSWMEDFSSLNDNLLILDTSANIQRLPIDRYGVTEEHADHSSEHNHSDLDPHIWLSPELVAVQASEICSTLSEIDPENSAVYRENLLAFQEEISLLQGRIHELLDPYTGSGFIVFHPSWGYFADEFSLVQVPIEIMGNEPSPSEMAALVDYGNNNSVKAIFAAPQFSESSAATIAGEINASVILIDPLSGDWSENLLFVATRLASVLEQ